MQIQHNKLNDTTYTFTVDGKYQFTCTVDRDSGRWVMPAFNKADHNVLSWNIAQIAHNQLGQYLRKEPLFKFTNKINGATGQRIWERNPRFA